MSSEIRGAGRPVTDPEEPGVPLDWLLAQERLGLRSLVDPCGPVAVRWAHSIDVADPTPWLLGGELVLTTGAYLGVDAAARHEHVRRAFDKRHDSRFGLSQDGHHLSLWIERQLV